MIVERTTKAKLASGQLKIDEPLNVGRKGRECCWVWRVIDNSFDDLAEDVQYIQKTR